MLCNFDNVNTLNNWAGAVISNDGTDFPGNSGNYARLTYSNIPAGDGTWWCCGRSLNDETPLLWVPVANLSDPLDNWAMKFEINTKVPWKTAVLYSTRIIAGTSWVDLAREVQARITTATAGRQL